MFEDRHDSIWRSVAAGAGTPGMAAARPTLIEASRIRVAGRIERRPFPGAPASAFAPSPGLGPDELAAGEPGAASIPAPGPDAWGPAIPIRSLSRQHGTRSRRTSMGCPRGPVCVPGVFRRGANGGSDARRPGGMSRRPKKHAGTIGCGSFLGPQARLSGFRIARDSCRYQE